MNQPTIWWTTTFGNYAWDVYGRECVESFGQYLPAEVRACVGLDDDELASECEKLLRAGDHVQIGVMAAKEKFITQYAAKDHPRNYRLQAARFCHKIFFLKTMMEKSHHHTPRYLVWWDADAIVNRPLSMNDIQPLLPTPQQAYSYLGRKDWDHSECGFMVFCLESEAARKIIDDMIELYTEGLVFTLPQWHDSYVFDHVRDKTLGLNISEGVAGNNVWAHTPLGSFSEHRKGIEAKFRKRALTDTELLGEKEAP
ncbi:MAG: hypothetical protein EBZ69_05700 [Alphaproteobacteria bacterium]|nr:hypothetical protein [Alphaproteobacteria bacterium]NDC56286.1 hypothetical protein [Alphaproteobacteria bacterium]NDG04414.1 hypothetical protein [Alphaproteobacteria bacterium]